MPGIPRSLTQPSKAQLEWHQYPTESQAVRACWREFFRIYPDALSWRPGQPQPVVLDHSMGTGVWGAVLKEFCPWVYLIGVELQIGPFSDKYDDVYIGWDFLDFVEAYLAAGKPLPALVFGNGPFKLLEEFFHAGLEILPPDGLMYNLVPDTFMSTKERSRRLWFPKAPQWVLHSTKRFRFDKTKTGTDYKEYLTVIHQKDNYPRAEEGYRGWWFEWDYGEPDIPEDCEFVPYSPYVLILCILKYNDLVNGEVYVIDDHESRLGVLGGRIPGGTTKEVGTTLSVTLS